MELPELLSEEVKEQVKQNYEKFAEGFVVPSEKEHALKQLKLVFNMARQPQVKDNFKTIVLANEKFKRIKEANEGFLTFLEEMGFEKQGEEDKYKFSAEQGDARVLEHVVKMM